MLNGVAPILIFSFVPSFLSGLFEGIAGIPVLGSIIPLGIPIPIYLDEKTTGIYIESESKAIDIDTVPLVRYDEKQSSVDQRGLNNVITVNMIANRDSIMLSVLLALNDMVFGRVVKQSYSVTYLNGATTVFNGLLHGFSAQQSSNDDITRITLQISKANLAPPVKGAPTLVNKAITGATPVAGAL